MRSVLAVSPHLDDAVLSAGGRITELAASGVQVTVFTVFAGDPSRPYSALARSLHKNWGLPADPVMHRRKEDTRALGHLMAKPRHGDYLDAIYRRNGAGNWLVDNGTWPTDHDANAEKELTGRIAATVRDLIAECRPELVLTCASVGGHVDHRHTADAVLAAAETTRTPVQLWTDLPYSAWTDLPCSGNHVRALPAEVAARVGPHRPEPFVVGQLPWARKLRAIAAYQSQHSMLWPGATDVYAVIDRQAADLAQACGAPGHCELYWCRAGE
jgi:LmbE family N-acetylglucosaminyl deacetylase